MSVYFDFFLQEQNVDLIFGNILDVHEFAVKFISSLEDTLEMSNEAQQPPIGACFLEMAEAEEFVSLEYYAEAILDPTCLESLQKCLLHPHVQKALEVTLLFFVISIGRGPQRITNLINPYMTDDFLNSGKGSIYLPKVRVVGQGSKGLPPPPRPSMVD